MGAVAHQAEQRTAGGQVWVMARERPLLSQLCASRHSLERSAPREHRELERLRGDVLNEVAQHFVERAGDQRLDTHHARGTDGSTVDRQLAHLLMQRAGA
jgi:hypothetical protein